MVLRTTNYMLSQAIRLVAVCFIVTVVGCASVPDRNPVPPDLTTKVGIPGIPEARFWGDENPEWSKKRMDTFTDADFRKTFRGYIINLTIILPSLAEVPMVLLALDFWWAGPLPEPAPSSPWLQG